MKEKITLSVDAKAKRRAEAYKKRTGMSLSEIFEHGVAHLMSVDTKGRHPFENLIGSLELTDEDAERDDRVGRIVRKIRATSPRTGHKAKRA
jgi:hypothetical protein